MGQRFLVSRAVLEKIIAAADLSRTDTVLEIGPGLGTLTRALAERAGRVIAVEKDGQLVEILREKLAAEGFRNVELIHGDILKLFPAHLPLPSGPYKVVANIPYYLTGRLLRLLLSGAYPPKEMLLMVQKEVAERIVAKPPKTNLLTLAVQAYGEPEALFRVPASAFHPRPRVDSALIRIKSIGKHFFIRHRLREEIFFKVLGAAFRGKRKTLENVLSKNLNVPKVRLRETLTALGLTGKRPEMLSLGEWGELTRALTKKVE